MVEPAYGQETSSRGLRQTLAGRGPPGAMEASRAGRGAKGGAELQDWAATALRFGRSWNRPIQDA
jgi:hypothetical protein